MNHNSVDGFEDYRRQRERMRRMGIGEKRPLSGPANALSQLEAVEAREERDRQLSREMHDFFESATRTAAEIVHKVAASAKLRIDQQLSSEMEEFLLDSITRMQGLVNAVLKDNSGSTPEQVIEPLMHNLVGQLLDTFRSAGTAGTDKHLGEDPMATNLEEVRREFQAKLPVHPPGEAAIVTPIAPPGGVLGGGSSSTSGPGLGSFGSTLGGGQTDVRPTIEDHLVAELDAAKGDKTGNDEQDLERFKQALDALVRQGSMGKSEASAALKARKSGRR